MADYISEPKKLLEALEVDYFDEAEKIGNKSCIRTIWVNLRRWIETKNTEFLDMAVIYCDEQGLPIKPTLQAHVAAAARYRVHRPSRSQNVAVPKPQRETVKEFVLDIVVQLCARGITRERACEVAAVWSVDVGNCPMRASSIEKSYGERPALKLNEDLLRSLIEAKGDTDQGGSWLAMERNCRAITSSEKGNRRQ